MFMSDEEARPEKKPKIPFTPVWRKAVCVNATSVSRSPIPVPVINSGPGTIEETSENRLQMHHIMHYLDNQTGKNRTIVVLTLYPGTDITQKIAKDGREVLFYIRSPHRLLAKEFINREETQEDDYVIFDDDHVGDRTKSPTCDPRLSTI
jgi:hypothetical protein